jgi:hypothetical protein
MILKLMGLIIMISYSCIQHADAYDDPIIYNAVPFGLDLMSAPNHVLVLHAPWGVATISPSPSIPSLNAGVNHAHLAQLLHRYAVWYEQGNYQIEMS